MLKSISIGLLEDYSVDAWEKTDYAKYYYDNFVNTKKTLNVLGLYEYTFRDCWLFFKNFWITSVTKADIDLIIQKNNVEHEVNDMIGIFSNKNLIMVMLESIDSFVVNEDVMPTLSYMMNNGWNFIQRYSALIDGGSTIATEFTSMTSLFYNDRNINYIRNNYNYSFMIF